MKVSPSPAVSSTTAIVKSSSTSRSKKGVPSSAININTATIDQLEQLPGIGPVMAQKVIDFRNKYGKFKKISDIQNVAGMGAAHYAKISKYIKVG
jgi:competence protein ComEA